MITVMKTPQLETIPARFQTRCVFPSVYFKCLSELSASVMDFWHVLNSTLPDWRLRGASMGAGRL